MTRPGKKHIPFVARWRGDRYRATVQINRTYDFEEAAAVLAIELPEGHWRFGKNTIHRTLQEAAHGMTGKQAKSIAKRRADPAMLDHYRNMLIEYGVFPPESDTRTGKEDAQDSSDTEGDTDSATDEDVELAQA